MSDAWHEQGGFVRAGETVLNGQLWAQAQAWLGQQSAVPAWINDQPDRAQFATGLLAASAAITPCLLPASSAADHLQQIQALFPGAQEMALPAVGADQPPLHPFAPVADQADALICFTSGSTGAPKAIQKSWAALHGALKGMAHAAGWQAGTTHIVATVPPQHMFGLEMSVLSALVCGCRVHAGKPFFPQDVVDAVELMPHPRVLVSTPLHLRALLKSGVSWPKIDQIISATAPLTQDLAEQLEQLSGGQVLEVYGSTETGAIATRVTAQTDVWSLFESARFVQAESAVLHAPHLPANCALQDEIEQLDARSFRLRGRPQNMLKVAGKRYSLDALNHQLQAVPGVEDAVALVPPDSDRPAALVVAPQLTVAQVRQALAQHVDAVFLPRPLLKLQEIPRNATGKVQRQALLRLLSA